MYISTFRVCSWLNSFRDKLEFMAESLAFSKTKDRKIIYDEIAPQIAALIEGETDLVANLANITAALKEAFGFFWVGFYLRKENQLVLSAFQGTIACTRINFDKGVCGHCYTTRETVIVTNVEEFPGHIACSSASKSEIVLPVFDKHGEVFGVLDVDSDKLNDFSEADAEGLKKIVKIIENFI
jgi:L-methionine (R)-S-oxide reductase